MSRKSKRRRVTNKRPWILFLAVIPLLAAAAFGVRHLFRSDPAEQFALQTKAANAAIEAEKYDEARIILTRLIERAPESIRLRRRLVSCLLELGRLDEARGAAGDLLKIDPDVAPAHAALAYIHRMSGDIDAAISEARLATRGTGVAEGAWYRLADILLDAGRRTDGVVALSRAVELGEGGTGAAIRLALLESGSDGKSPILSRARRTIERALEAAREEWELAPESDEALGGFVGLAMLAGDPSSAASALLAARDRRDLSPSELLMLARATGRTGQMERAAKLLAELADEPGSGVTDKELALAWLELGDPARALAFADLANEAEPDALPIMRLRVEILAQLVEDGGPDAHAAAEQLNAAADALLIARPQDELGLRARAFGHLVLGRLTSALADAVALRDLGSSSPAAPWIQGICMLRLGNAEGALPLLEEGRAAAPSPDAAAQWIAVAAVQVGDRMRAAREAPNLRGDRFLALRAAAEATAGNLETAGELLAREGFSSTPPEDRIAAAIALSRAGREGPAKGILDGIDVGGLDPWARLRVGDAYRGLREKDPATRVYEEAAAGEGALANAALMRLGKMAIAGSEIDREALATVLARLENTESGAGRARVLETLVAVKEKKPAEALEASAAALRLLPDNWNALGARLAALELAGADRPELDAVADRLLTVDPGHLGARLHRARSNFERGLMGLVEGELEVAEESFSEVMSRLPGADRARVLRGFARVGRGDLARAEEDARLLIESSEKPARGHVLQGVLHLRRGRPDLAIESLEVALAEVPESGTALASYALALGAAKRFDDALAALDRLDAVEEGSFRALAIRARIHVSAGRPEDALKVLERAIESGLESVQARLALVSCLALAKRSEEALGAADKIVADESTRILGLLSRSRVNRMRGALAAEQADLREVCSLDPENLIALTRLGEILLEAGRTEEGRGFMERAAALGTRGIEARMRLALLAEREGRSVEAAELYEEVLAVRPDHALAANNLACYLMASKEDLPRAVELAHIVARARPRHPDYRDTLAQVLSAAGLHREAAEESRVAMRLAPESAEIAKSSALVLRSAGHRDEARRAAGRALDLIPIEDRDALVDELDALGLMPE